MCYYGDDDYGYENEEEENYLQDLADIKADNESRDTNFGDDSHQKYICDQRQEDTEMEEARIEAEASSFDDFIREQKITEEEIPYETVENFVRYDQTENIQLTQLYRQWLKT